MPLPTPELGLQKAVDADDTADYLDTSLANSLTTLDGLFNNVSGHTHAGVHQGGPISSIAAGAIPDGSITSAKIADGGIGTVDLADGSVTSPKIAGGAVGTAQIAASPTLTTPTLTSPTINGGSTNNVTENSPTLNTPTISGTVSGTATFGTGPRSTDWFRNETSGQGIYNDAAGQGVGLDNTGAFIYPSNDRVISANASQTLANKTLTNPTLNNGTLNSPTLNTPSEVSPNISGTATVTGALAVNGNALLGGGALPVNSTINFPYISLMAGAPTGVPNAGGGGRAAMVWDSGNRRLWIYDGSWHYVQFS